MLFKYSFEICIAKMYLYFFNPLKCMFDLEKHVRVLFEGNILLTAWLQDPLISSFSWAKDSGPVLSRQCDPCSGLVLVFKASTGLFLFSLSPAFLLLSIGCICEKTITC